jgi:hypothetical protein
MRMYVIGEAELTTPPPVQYSKEEIEYQVACRDYRCSGNTNESKKEHLLRLKELAVASKKQRELRDSAFKEIDKAIKGAMANAVWLTQANRSAEALTVLNRAVHGLPPWLVKRYKCRAPILSGNSDVETNDYIEKSAEALRLTIDEILYRDRYIQLQTELKEARDDRDLPTEIKDKVWLAILSAVEWPVDDNRFQQIPKSEQEEIVDCFQGVLKSNNSIETITSAIRKIRLIKSNSSEERMSALNEAMNPYLMGKSDKVTRN